MITKKDKKCSYEKIREHVNPLSDDCIMIIVPHEDDEILMTAGIIERCVNDGINVKVVIATNGDCDANTYEKGHNRMRESLDAVRHLGLSSENVIFLGYADTGMIESESFITRLYNSISASKVYASSCSDQTYGLEGEADEYHYKSFGKHAPYNKVSFMFDMISVIKEHMPKHIFVTSIFDLHGDHSALCRFTIDAVKSIKNEFNQYTPCLHQGIVHSPAGDDVWPEVEEDNSQVAGYTIPPDFNALTSMKWEEREIFTVPEDMLISERAKNRKYQAILKHKSALKPNEPEVVKYLLSFVKSEEIFWKIEIQNFFNGEEYET